MNLPVLTAVADPRWEAALVAALADDTLGITVVRRCVDVADLLAAATAGLARAVVLSADLRLLDRDVVTRLDVLGVAVVGVCPADDETARLRLSRLGVGAVVATDATASEVAAALAVAVDALSGGASSDDAAVAVAATPAPTTADARGCVVAVWGPTGAPGRTSTAVGLAAEIAAAGSSALLVDADAYGGTVGQALGVLDESAGLAAACALANTGRLDTGTLAALALQVNPRLRVLTGIQRADRWTELRPSAVEAVLGLARELAAYVVVDCGFCLEEDEELSYDTVAPRRNGATLAVLVAADTVVVVGSADPVALQRLVRALSELAHAGHEAQPLVVVNRLRAGAVGPGDARGQIDAALSAYAGVGSAAYVPLDVDAFDRALAAGRTLVEVAPESPARLAMARLAARVTGEPVATSRSRWRRAPRR